MMSSSSTQSIRTRVLDTPGARIQSDSTHRPEHTLMRCRHYPMAWGSRGLKRRPPGPPPIRQDPTLPYARPSAKTTCAFLHTELKGTSMTPEKGLLQIKTIAKSHGWSFYAIHNSLPDKYLSDAFLIKLASNDATAMAKIQEHCRNLFHQRSNACK